MNAVRSPLARCRGGSGAFTLIEVLIRSAIMSMIIVSAYLCFNAAISTRKTLEPRIEVVQTARVALALMAADLRAACPLDKDNAFVGMQRTMGETAADNLDFATHNYTPRRAREGDFCQVSYYLDRDPETGEFSLWRRRNPAIAPDSFSGGSKEEIATGVSGLQFEYYDGFDWYSTWGDVSGTGKQQTSQKEQPNLTGMPEAVRITLWLDSEPLSRKGTDTEADSATRPAPMVFETVVRLELAKATAAASRSASASDGSSASEAGAARPESEGGSNP